MDYIRITLQLTPDIQDFRDLLMATLGEIGFESFVENEADVEAYIPVRLTFEDELRKVDFSPLFTFTFKKELIPDQNWNELWEKNYFKPLLIANTCVIRAPFHIDFPKAQYEIIIEPNMAFGTGNHETTTMMIEHIIELPVAGKTILDMGCGTGILSIFASMKGAKAIKAIDIDQWSFESTRDNSTINHCNNIEVVVGDASSIGNNHYDIILANIHKNVLIEDMEKYYNALNTGGALVMSGFYEHDLHDIQQRASTLNFSYINCKQKNKWVAATFKK